MVDKNLTIKALQWCFAKWGVSDFQDDYPRIRILSKPSKQTLTGWYCEEKNLITVNLHANENPLELVKTVIHEYTHYLQDLENLYDALSFAYRNKPYREHPLEKQAYGRERRWGRTCLREIM
jgi:hypothetical protein